MGIRQISVKKNNSQLIKMKGFHVVGAEAKTHITISGREYKRELLKTYKNKFTKGEFEKVKKLQLRELQLVLLEKDPNIKF